MRMAFLEKIIDDCSYIVGPAIFNNSKIYLDYFTTHLIMSVEL